MKSIPAAIAVLCSTLLMSTSCSNEEKNNDELSETFKVQILVDSKSRTHINKDGNVSWSDVDNEKLGVTINGIQNNVIFENDYTSSNLNVFQGTFNVTGQSVPSVKLWAFYPSDTDFEFSGNQYKGLVLSDEQMINYDGHHNFMVSEINVSYSEPVPNNAWSVNFDTDSYLFAMIRVPLKGDAALLGEKITNVRLEAVKTDLTLTGTFDYNLETKNIVWQKTNNYVNMRCEETKASSVFLGVDTAVYFVVKPFSSEKMKLIVETEHGSATFTTPEFTANKGKLTELPIVDVNSKWTADVAQYTIISEDEDHNGIDGVTVRFRDAATGNVIYFNKIRDGVYEYSPTGDVEYLTTANVSGQNGKLIIKNFPSGETIYNEILSSPLTWGVQDVGTIGHYQSTVDLALTPRVDVVTLKYDNSDVASIPIPDVISGIGTWEYVPELSDEFNGGFLDASKWHNGSGVIESTVSNGYLECPTTMAPDKLSYVEFIRKGAGYGYYEGRIRCAYLKAPCAFWLYSNGSGGNPQEDIEIDIFEIRPDNKVDEAANKHYGCVIPTSTHNWAYSYSRTVFGDQCSTTGLSYIRKDGNIASCSSDFMTYGLLYTPEKVACYVNGVMTYEVDFNKELPRDLNLKLASMFWVIETHLVEDQPSYTADEVNNSLRSDGSGLKINTMYTDYVRYYRRTDLVYTDLVHQYPDKETGTAIAKVPQSPLSGTWQLQADKSDECDDNDINLALWYYALGTQYEYDGTLRMPVDCRTNVFLFKNTEVIASNYLHDSWLESYGLISKAMKTQETISFGKGYYEFRMKASQTDNNSSICFVDKSTHVPQLSLMLFGDPKSDIQRKSEVCIENKNGEWVAKSLSGNSGDDFHIYGIEIGDGVANIYVDGTLAQTYTITLSDDMYIMVGDYYMVTNGSGNTYEELTDGRDVNCYLDYMRVYKKQ